MKKWKLTRKRVLLVLGMVFLLAVVSTAVIVATPYLRSHHTITLRDDGFHPRTLTIRAGDTVTFKSTRTKYFWPASDPHPTHTDFAVFDSKAAIAPSRSWSFTFTDPGTFRYHDHLEAYYSGIIQVVGTDGKIVDDCMAHGGKLACWQNQIFLSLTTGGLDAAYDTIGQLYAADPTFPSSCHFLTHNVGLASYQLYRENPELILSPKAVGCAAGFYHGFMEGYLGATGDVHSAAALCDRIGEKISDQAPDARLQCFHGIGHGSIETAIATTGLFESADALVATAVENCEAASPGTDERYRCVSGIYNAIANFYIGGQYGLSIKTTDPLALCSRQKVVYKEACYGNMNSLALVVGENDFTAAAKYLLTMPDPEYRARAIQYLGSLTAMNYVGTDKPLAAMVTACNRLSGGFSLDCVKGFDHGLLEHGRPDAPYIQALEFCKEPGLTATERDGCYSVALGELRGWFSDAQSRTICASVAPALQKYCAPD